MSGLRPAFNATIDAFPELEAKTRPKGVSECRSCPPKLIPCAFMDARQTPADAERKAFSEADFLAWLDEDSTPALVSKDHDRFYAYCVEFGIAGSGRTKDEAVANAVNLMMRYLVLSFCEGRTYRDAKKPPPIRIRIRSWYLVVRTKLLRGIKPPLSRLGGLISVPTTNRDTRRLAH